MIFGTVWIVGLAFLTIAPLIVMSVAGFSLSTLFGGAPQPGPARLDPHDPGDRVHRAGQVADQDDPACMSFTSSTTVTTTTSTTTSTTLPWTFAAQVQPLLATKCAGCHGLDLITGKTANKVDWTAMLDRMKS